MQEDNKVRNVELAYLGLCLKGVQPNELNFDARGVEHRTHDE